MPYLDASGYCVACDKITPHRFSKTIFCKTCGKKSTQLEFKQGVDMYTRRNFEDPLNPNRPIFDIWSEGFIATGDRGYAFKHGSVRADTFKDACILHFGNNELFNVDKMTYRGCELFDNEADARRSFG